MNPFRKSLLKLIEVFISFLYINQISANEGDNLLDSGMNLINIPYSPTVLSLKLKEINENNRTCTASCSMQLPPTLKLYFECKHLTENKTNKTNATQTAKHSA